MSRAAASTPVSGRMAVTIMVLVVVAGTKTTTSWRRLAQEAVAAVLLAATGRAACQTASASDASPCLTSPCLLVDWMPLRLLALRHAEVVLAV